MNAQQTTCVGVALVIGLVVLSGCGPSQEQQAQPPKPTIPTDGLVAYYKFDGDATDHSGNENQGELHGAVPAADRFGKADGAYSFDGVDDYVEI